MRDDRKRGASELPPLPTTRRSAEPDGAALDPRAAPTESKLTFRLAVLDCPTCAAPLDAESVDVVFYCTACRNGYRLERSSDGVAPARLAPVEVGFLSAPSVAADRWVPFWRLPATVEIEGRSAGGRKFQFRDFQLLNKLFPNEAPGASARGRDEVVFAVPAFEASIQSVQRLIYDYTFRAPALGERIGERLTGGVYGVRDAQKLAHYAFVTAEIRRPDTLKNLRYRLEFGEATLLGVPAIRERERFKDALFSVPF